MIDPKNQIIIVKGKRVEFDSLPLRIQEILLTSWKLKKTKERDKQETNINSENGSSESENFESKPVKRKRAKTSK